MHDPVDREAVAGREVMAATRRMLPPELEEACRAHCSSASGG